MAVSTDFDELLRMPCCTIPLRLVNPSDDRLKKGKVLFYCPKCGMKYHGEIAAIREWLNEQRKPKSKKKG